MLPLTDINNRRVRGIISDIIHIQLTYIDLECQLETNKTIAAISGYLPDIIMYYDIGIKARMYILLKKSLFILKKNP